MGTIVDKLNLLLSTKSAIKAAIIAKGQPIADSDPFSGYADKIAAIETGIQLPTLTTPGAAADLLTGKQLIDQDGNILTGAMPEVDQATPSISVSASGLITASAAQSGGKVAAGTKSATSQLSTQAGTTITPGTAAKTAVAAGRYTTGAVQVAGDANLVAANIKSGVSIFGVTGSYAGVNLNRITPNSVSVDSSGTITIPVTGITPSSILVSVCIPFRLRNEATWSEDLIGGGYYYNNTPWIILDIFTDSYCELTAYEVTIGNGYIKIANGLYSLFNSQGSFDVTIMSDQNRIPQVCYYNT